MTWIANCLALSPDLNVAEHAVAGAVDKYNIASGTCTSLDRLKRIVNKTWKDYAQASLDASIASMPNRIASVIRRKGDYLMKGDDY